MKNSIQKLSRFFAGVILLMALSTSVNAGVCRSTLATEEFRGQDLKVTRLDSGGARLHLNELTGEDSAAVGVNRYGHIYVVYQINSVRYRAEGNAFFAPIEVSDGDFLDPGMLFVFPISKTQSQLLTVRAWDEVLHNMDGLRSFTCATAACQALEKIPGFTISRAFLGVPNLNAEALVPRLIADGVEYQGLNVQGRIYLIDSESVEGLLTKYRQTTKYAVGFMVRYLTGGFARPKMMAEWVEREQPKLLGKTEVLKPFSER